MVDEPVEQHTSELKTQEDAEADMLRLQRKGWSVYHERLPLAGQAGYYCVQVLTRQDGSEYHQAHSLRWNLFSKPLIPVTIDCTRRTTLFGFLCRHCAHEDFEYFEYGDGDVGLVCYCNASRGWSEVLRVSDDFDHDLDETCQEIFGELGSVAL